MENNQEILAQLAGIGAAMGAGKLLVSKEPLEARLVLGRIILGSGASVAAGTVYILFPTLHPLALIGIASLTGLSGAAWLELLFKRKIESLIAKEAEDKPNV